MEERRGWLRGVIPKLTLPGGEQMDQIDPVMSWGLEDTLSSLSSCWDEMTLVGMAMYVMGAS